MSFNLLHIFMKEFFGHFSKTFIAVAGCCILVLLPGCSENKLPTEHVTGTLTLDGQVLAGAKIFFNPAGGGIPAYGITNEKGVYLITAMQGGAEGAGTVPGEYIVTMSKIETTEHDTGGGRMVADNKNVLHPVYADTKQTPFRATVIKDKNSFDYALESKPSVSYTAPPPRTGGGPDVNR
jgi:hypothetical protein